MNTDGVLNIGENLKYLRSNKKYSMEKLAEIIGVSRQAIAKWENNESYPDIVKCNEIAKIYNVSLDALVNGTIENLLEEDNPEDKYVFGLAQVGEHGQITLPEKAYTIFEISEGDRLLVLGDKKKGIAIVKASGIHDFL